MQLNEILVRIITPVIAVGFILNCGGGGSGSGGETTQTSPAPVLTLHYTENPNSNASSWRLVADPVASTPSKLVLNLYAPIGQKIQGATLFLSVSDEMVAWARPEGAVDPFVKPGPGMNLALGSDPSIQMIQGHVDTLNNLSNLQVAVYQKSIPVANNSENSIMSISLTKKTGSTSGPVTLVQTPGKASLYLGEGGVILPCNLLIGGLSIQ